MSHPSDEILSARLDGEAVAAADGAHIDGCAACRTRLDELRAVTVALRAPMLPPARLREAAVASALVETTGARAAVRRRLARRRPPATRPARPTRHTNAASAAAALAVAVGVGGWLVSQSGNSPATTTNARRAALAPIVSGPRAESANPTLANSTRAAGSRSASAAAEAQPKSTTFFDAGAIGEYNQLAAIIDKAKADLSASIADARAAAEAPCPPPAGETIEWHASLTYRGVAAFARVVRSTSSVRVLEVLDQADCALVESQTI
ncbi:MAG TPA: hypothetical protein VHC63_00490 [Acidimicrobiales bacterium]|nr:hypothetical protein [Acidimicrobiales bacterium]